MSRFFLSAGCLLAGLSVAFGAFGAHGLKKILQPDALQTFETGVRYQMYHSIALLFVGLYIQQHPSSNMAFAGWCLLGGIVLFSGSLYGLALGGPRWLGPVTPLGGLLWLLAWSLAAIACWKHLPQ